MPDPARATCYYIDHDGLLQAVPATDGMSELKVKFGIVMTNGQTRIYGDAGEIGGADQVAYSVHDSGAVKVVWQGRHSEWLAPGSWQLIRDASALHDLLSNP